MPNRESPNMSWVRTVVVVFVLSLAVSPLHGQDDQDENSDPEVVENEDGPTSGEDVVQSNPNTTGNTSNHDSIDASDDAENSETPNSEEESVTSESVETPDFFDPTEEISEDYAVPFPVDI